MASYCDPKFFLFYVPDHKWVRVGYLKIIHVKITGKVDASWDV
jgi:hypothetical protein